MSQPPFPGQYPEQPQSGPPYPGQPYPVQPYPGQPNPDVPSSVPPQPGFPPPPGYGQQPGYPIYGQPTPPPPQKSRALPITLMAIAVVLVLCVGGGTAAFLLVRNTTENIADSLESAAPTPGETTEPTTDPTPAEQAKTITIVEPKKLGGRQKLTDKRFAAGTEQMESQLSQIPGVTNSVGAIYGAVDKRNMVFMAAVEAPVPDPEQQLDSLFAGGSIGGMRLDDIADVEPGPLGGSARCGDGELAGENTAFCAWADEGSGGWFMWYFKSVKQVSGEFAKLRGEIEKSS